jgi:acyl-coenzyme A synthetase/AMP-(fatty) acid ligase
MTGIILNTSGSTDEPKQIGHRWAYIKECAQRSVKEIGLTENDIVLDVFPGNTIAHYTITAFPALISGAQLVTANFSSFTYLELFESVQPSVISLIPRHLELLSKSKKWDSIDMSCVRYMVTGSNKIEQSFIDAFRERGVQLVANWYGMTEYPPPVMIGYNSTSFDLKTLNNRDHVMFHPVSATSSLAECIINGRSTGDIFDMETKEFHSRRVHASGKTWKTSI